MMISEHELRERLLGEDDAVAEATLREHFTPVARMAMGFDWCPQPELRTEGEPEDDGDTEVDHQRRQQWRQRMIDLANGAERRLRRRRFQWRLRRRPQWPIVVCEGDSWVAHPLIHDLTDRLSDELRHSFNLLSQGAGGDLLAQMEREREMEAALVEVDARALLLSGGGNDMLDGFEDLQLDQQAGRDPIEWILEVLEPHMVSAMASMERVLTGVRRVAPTVPVVVHGYDYLRPGPPGRGRFLAPHFDRLGIDDHRVRLRSAVALVDRFNVHLGRLVAKHERVRHVDLRGRVPDDEWRDEIHPDKRGFSRLGDVVAEVLREEIG
ncbi:MAG: SGNH/GDSL hydrolase family protein [Nannocystaceae bacterium]